MNITGGEIYMAIIDMKNLQDQIDSMKTDIGKLKENVYPSIYIGGFKSNINTPVTALNTSTTINVNQLNIYDMKELYSILPPIL